MASTYGNCSCPKVELVLSGDERATSLRWERRAKSAQALAEFTG